jgi:DNA repair protein RecN (Recombination protein N)
MIRELTIKNLALIDDMHIEFSDGFTILTGETGAGKSILAGAIGLLLGNRASSEAIRSGCDEAEVIGVFEFDTLHPEFKRRGEALGIELNDGMIVHRRITKTGRNRIYINEIPVTLNSLTALGSYCIDLVSQHEHQSLLEADSARTVIDSLPEVEPVRKKYDAAYGGYIEKKQEIEQFDRRAEEVRQRREFIEFQYNELRALELKENEETSLSHELSLLSSQADRIEIASRLYSLCAGDEHSVQQKMRMIKRALDSLIKYDPSLEPWRGDIDNAFAVLTELESFCSSYVERMEQTDPNRIEYINNRLAKIQRLKKKHACSYEGLREKQTELKRDLDSIENEAYRRRDLEKAHAERLRQCTDAGMVLRKQREKFGARFCARIEELMKKVGFADNGFEIRYTPCEQPRAEGCESLEFFVRTNPGEPFLPLSKSASGGEISRLMLAIKRVLAERDKIPTLIFDEVDTGIGGRVAKEIGRMLHDLAATHQVFCISHLHQIASCAEHHLLVYKTQENRRTVTRVQHLDPEQKIDEIARMLGGESHIARQHAEELLGGKRKR